MVVRSAILGSELRENLTKNVACERGAVHVMLIIKSILFQEEGK